MIFFCLIYLILNICKCDSFINEKKITDYFNSATFNSFQKQWQKERIPYENAIGLSLKDSYGYKGMNVYIRKSADSQRIANGFYVYDNVVGVMGQHMFLGELPHFISPEVTFALASNVLRLETGLSRTFVYTQYILFRNHSDIVYGGENSSNHSPFAHQDVQDTGPVAIIAEDCTLSGYAITKLNGQAVDLGHNTFTVSDCKFSVEISATGMGIEPITAPYLNSQQSVLLEKLISKPIRDELLPKLQASLLSYVNTTNIFDDSLPKYRHLQSRLFKDISKDILNKIRTVNKNTMRMNQGMAPLKSFSITWTVCEDKPCDTTVYLNDVFLYGLDTVYSPYNGGPYKLQSTKVGESIRFNYIQVRGKVGIKTGSKNKEHDFFAEIYDAAVNIEIDLSKQVNTADFVDWKSLELSITDFKETLHERIRANSLIAGHLLYEVPTVLKKHAIIIFGDNGSPNKLTLNENTEDSNVVPNSSQGFEPEVSQEKNDLFKKKVFDKRGEISKGGVYKLYGSLNKKPDNAKVVPYSSLGLEHQLSDEYNIDNRDEKKTFNKRGEISKGGVYKPLAGHNIISKKKVFDKRGEVSIKKKSDEDNVSDSLPPAKSEPSSSQEDKESESEDNTPSVMSHLKLKGNVERYKKKSDVSFTSSSQSVEDENK